MTDESGVIKRGTGIKGAKHILEFTKQMKEIGVSEYHVSDGYVKVTFHPQVDIKAASESVRAMEILAEKSAVESAQDILFHSTEV